MKTKRRVFLCCLMTLMMAFVMAVPMSASAAVSSINDAIAKGETNITLDENVTENVVIPADKTVTINLNGHKITNYNDGDTITVKNGAKLTITGEGTVDNVTHLKGAIFNEGEVVLNGGTYDRSKEAGKDPKDNGGNSWYTICNHGIMTIDGDVTVNNKGAYSSMIENGYQNYGSTNSRTGYVAGTNAANPTLTINAGTFTGGINSVKNDDGGKLVIAGGTYRNTAQAAVLNWNVAEIRDGDFEVTTNHAVVLNGRNDANMNGGEVLNKGDLKISGGKFIAPEGVNSIGKMNGNANMDDVDVSGGKFSSDVAEYVRSADKATLVDSDNDVLSYEIIPADDANAATEYGAVRKVEDAGNVYYYRYESDIPVDIGDESITTIAYDVNFYLTDENGNIIDENGDLINENSNTYMTITVPVTENNAQVVKDGLPDGEDTLPILPNVDMYHFVGWYTAEITADGSMVEKYLPGKLTLETNVTEDMDVYAAWSKEDGESPVPGGNNQQGTTVDKTKTDASAQTGDDFNMGLAFAIMALAGLAAVGTVVVRRRTN